MQFFSDIILVFIPLVSVVLVISTYFYMRNHERKGVERYNELQSDYIKLETRYEIIKGTMEKEQSERDALQVKCAHLENENTKLLTEHRLSKEKEQEYKKQIEDVQKSFRVEFENVTNRIFSSYTDQFSKSSKESIQSILSPLSSEIQKFEKRVEESFSSEVKERYALKREIENIVETSKNIGNKAENLAMALRGNVKLHGNWGEVMLERILEESGLRKNTDYTVQGAQVKLQNDRGEEVRPDVVIHLPDEKHIIIDSKLSLLHYQDYCNAVSDKDAKESLKLFLTSVRNHINILAQRNYNRINELTTPDFVLMFMPIESSYSLAIEQDHDLHRQAWSKKIVIVHPSTLFSTLQIISSIWRVELQKQNAQAIAEESGKLYDKIVGFIEDVESVSKSIDNSRTTFDKAMGKLYLGKGNIVSKCEKIQKLGANSSKKIPKISSA